MFDGSVAPPEVFVVKKDDEGLEELRLTTQMIREHQAAIKKLGERRRKVALRLRDNGITYKRMAEVMGVTDIAVFKILKGNEDRVPPKP
jgi:hypothetical protein